jgi:hypothetical protein
LNQDLQRKDGDSTLEQTPEASWLTVMLGGAVVIGNAVELGGVQDAARVWTAWMLAGLLVVHGVSLAWRARYADDLLRVPKWSLIALLFVLWLGCAWWQDQTTPWFSRESFILAVEGWLLSWVVAATPGGRSLSWAWLLIVAVAAGLALLAAVGWQASGDGLWLPTGRSLPEEWVGRWSGSLPLPGAFGALMLLAGSPLLVMACSRHLPAVWRILCGSGGLAMLFGAILSNALGVWIGVAFVVVVFPLVVGHTWKMRVAGWLVGLAFLAGMVEFRLAASDVPLRRILDLLNVGEPDLATTRAVIAHVWQQNLWFGGRGAPMADLARAAGVPGPLGGWSYGFSDWTDLAATWGLGGFGLAAFILVGLQVTAWASWAKLPFLVSIQTDNVPTDKNLASGLPETYSFTPEAKVLLGAGALGLAAFTVAMCATRSLNLPSVVFAFAVVAGVLSRNIPQRGGSWRLEAVTRGVLALSISVILAVWLVRRVAMVDTADYKLEEAGQLLLDADRQPDEELLVRAEADLREVLAADPVSVRALTNLAWLELEEARLEPDQSIVCSQRAEYDALRASDLAPLAAEPWVARALACWLDGRFDDAGNHLSHALELTPCNPEAQFYSAALLAARLSVAEGIPPALTLPPRYAMPPPWPPVEGEPDEDAAPRSLRDND